VFGNSVFRIFHLCKPKQSFRFKEHIFKDLSTKTNIESVLKRYEFLKMPLHGIDIHTHNLLKLYFM